MRWAGRERPVANNPLSPSPPHPERRMRISSGRRRGRGSDNDVPAIAPEHAPGEAFGGDVAVVVAGIAGIDAE